MHVDSYGYENINDMNHMLTFQNLIVCLVVRISDVAMQLIAKHDTQTSACFICRYHELVVD